MNTEQERAAFETWAEQRGMELHKVTPCNGSLPYYADTPGMAAWEAWKARAALQSQYEIQLQVWRSTDFCMEFWSWDEADQYDYDHAKPENRRIIQIVKEG